MTDGKRHLYKTLKFNGEKVRIDEEIAPLLSKMWKLGINTNACCQAHCRFECKHKVKVHPEKDGRTFFETIRNKNCLSHIWISFDTAFDVEMFYNYVAEYVKNDIGTMYGFINGYNQKEYPNDVWRMIFIPRNYGVERHFGRPTFNGKRSTQEMWMEDGCKKNDFVMNPQLTFPRKHLQYVEERLDLALKRIKIERDIR